MKRPRHFGGPKDEKGNILDTPKKRAMYLKRINEELADQFRSTEPQTEGTREHSENLKWQLTAEQTAIKFERRAVSEQRKENLQPHNHDRRDAAVEREADIRQVWKPGMSAMQVAAALRRNGVEPPSKATINRHLKKIRYSEN